jgi:hypothetical protein
VFTALETLDTADFADQSHGITDASSGSTAEQLGLRAVLDQAVAGLVEESLALLAGGDVIDEVMDALTDGVSADIVGQVICVDGGPTVQCVVSIYGTNWK